MNRLRRAADRAQVILALVVVLAVLAQVYLIGAYFFGAGKSALDAHKEVGGITHGIEVLVFVAALIAWLPRADRWLSFVLILIGTIQLALADSDRWVGGLHPLLAMFVLGLAALLAIRGVRRVRAPGEPAVA